MNINDIKNQYRIKIDKVSDLLGGFLNKKMVVESNKKKYVIKIISSNKFDQSHLKDLIPSITDLITYLNHNGLKCPKLYSTTQNKYYFFKKSDYCVLMDYEKGEIKDHSNILTTEMYSLGKEVAKMHLLMRDYKKFKEDYNFMKLKTLDDLYQDLIIRENQGKECEKYALDISNHKNIIDDIKDTKFLNNLEIQLIHGDLAQDNILFFNNEISSIIDFELVRYNSILQDIGRVLISFTLNDKEQINMELIDSFIEGYNKQKNNVKISRLDIIKAFKIVWINEVHLWIKKDYYIHKNTLKVDKFIQEINWITKNWFKLDKIIMEG